MKLPSWFKTVAIAVAGLMVVILLGAALSAPGRWIRADTGRDQPRAHHNTKNTTRLAGDTPGEIAARVAQSVYPGTTPENSADLLLVYDDANWQAGLAAAALVRPLNALLLPASAVATLPEDFAVNGSDPVGSAEMLFLDGATVENNRFAGEALDTGEIAVLLQEADSPPAHAILADQGDPETAILAAPWAAYSGDLVIFNVADAPAGVPIFALGDVVADGDAIADRIHGRNADGTAVAFAAYDNDAHAGTALFGWGMNADSLTGYRSYTIAPRGEYATGLLSANLARRGKPGPLFWSDAEELPQGVYNYFFSQRAAFWNTPSEGPFHHFYVLGNTEAISFKAQGQADYAVEIGPYFQKGFAAGPMDMLASAWVLLGVASAVWIALHEAKFLPYQNWLMKLAWPLMALMSGPFGILFYRLAYSRPLIKHGKMLMWDRPLWLQGMVATASAVGFGGLIMVTSGYLVTLFGMPLIPMDSGAFILGTPMILVMIINYVVAVVVAWLLYQTPMVATMHQKSYREALPMAFPLVVTSMLAAAAGMNPSMWWFMMSKFPMMPTEESILWFGTMFVTVFLAFLVAWPLNYFFVRTQRKAGLM